MDEKSRKYAVWNSCYLEFRFDRYLNSKNHISDKEKK